MKMTNKVEKTSNNVSALKYSGDICVKILDNERVLETRNYHNTGCTKLFDFLADCLTGNFTGAKDKRPCRIVLFENDLDHPTYILEDGKNKFQINSFNESCRVSTKVFYDSTPAPQISDGKASITYHFRIPFLCLTGGKKVTKLGLFTNLISYGYQNDLCAYYILDDEEAIAIPEAGGNFTIIIDWKLSIQNN